MSGPFFTVPGNYRPVFAPRQLRQAAADNTGSNQRTDNPTTPPPVGHKKPSAVELLLVESILEKYHLDPSAVVDLRDTFQMER